VTKAIARDASVVLGAIGRALAAYTACPSPLIA